MHKRIAVYDNTVSARTYISYIAEQAGGFACIGRDGKLYIKTIGQDIAQLPLKYFQNFKWGDKFLFTRIRYEDGVQLFEHGDTTGNTIYINQDNMFIIDQEQIDNIYNQLNGLEVYSFEGSSIIDPALDIGDLLVIDNKYVIYQGVSEYGGKFKANITSKIQCKAKEETMTRTSSPKTSIRRVQSQINQINGEIVQLVEETTETKQNLENIIDTTENAEGKNIHIEDSTEDTLISIKLNGETSQETSTEGKNKYDRILYPLEQGTIGSVIGSTRINMSSTTRLRVSISFPVKPNTEYTLSVPQGFNLAIKEFDDDEKLITTLFSNWTSGNTATFITSSTTSLLAFLIKKTNDSTIIDSDVEWVQLEEGTEATEYEEYIPNSPSPEYPSPIINVQGRNIFDKNTMSTQYNRYISSNTTWTYSADSYSIIIPCKPNTKYIVSHSNNAETIFRMGFIKDPSPSGTTVITLYNGYRGTTEKSHVLEGVEGATFIVVQCSSANILTTLETLQVRTMSIETKITGKNIFDSEDWYNTLHAISSTSMQKETVDGIEYYKFRPANIYQHQYMLGQFKPNTQYTISFKGRQYDRSDRMSTGLRFNYTDGTKTNIYITGDTTERQYSVTSDLDKTISYISLLYNYNDFDLIRDIQLKEGTVTSYEPYKSQTVLFPLAEGQKLYEGSYLADDGIHNVRRQVILDGSSDEAWTTNGSKQGYGIVINNVGGNEKDTIISDILCDCLKPVKQSTIYDGSAINGVATLGGSLHKIYVRYDSTITTVALLRTKLASQPITIEYPLVEEEVIPYTTEQQEAWDNIKKLYTYYNITNIISDAYLEIEYVRDNGLDIYETKHNAGIQYTETIAKLAEQKITMDSINNVVSETITKLNNDYLTAEQTQGQLDTLETNLETISEKATNLEQTSTQLQLDINRINSDGVTKVTTSTGFTFNENGLSINKTGAETGTIIDEAGLHVKATTGDTDLLYAGYVKEDNTDYEKYKGQTIVAAANMIVKNYLVVPNSRFESYSNPVLGGSGTGVFGV